MNIIQEKTIFDYTEIENLGDLERLNLFFENIEDDELLLMSIIFCHKSGITNAPHLYHQTA